MSSRRGESVPNAPVRERFERLAERHGREQLAEHVALRLGWDVDGRGNRQQPYQYRRGVLVALGLMVNRHDQTTDKIPAHRAAAINGILERVEGGSPLEREAAEPIAPPHRAPVGPPKVSA